MTTTYLRTYPTLWPVFGTKNYVKDNDGWWHWKPKNKFKKNSLSTNLNY